MSLPKWVEEASRDVGKNRWTKAIRIAWEVLEAQSLQKSFVMFPMMVRQAKEALRRIEEMGK